MREREYPEPHDFKDWTQWTGGANPYRDGRAYIVTRSGKMCLSRADAFWWGRTGDGIDHTGKFRPADLIRNNEIIAWKPAEYMTTKVYPRVQMVNLPIHPDYQELP